MVNQSISFSIIVATKDRPHSIKVFLSSLKNAGVLKRRDTEVIIVDNNSMTGDTKNLCKLFGVRYGCEHIPGKSRALNRGVKMAKGEFCVFTDDDVTVLSSNWLDKLAGHFFKNPKLGYVSGNVLARELISTPMTLWERKGGLSKGSVPKHFTVRFLNQFKIRPWPLTKICAGANCMIPKKVLDEIGGFRTLFGPGAAIGHGESLEIGYRIIKTGHELYYDPEAIVFHDHPVSAKEIKKKLFLYAIGDTAIHAYIFMRWKDLRSLFWAFGGHQLYLIGNMIKRIRGNYALPTSYIITSLGGSVLGGLLFYFKYCYLILSKQRYD